MKITYYCDNCSSYINTARVEGLSLAELGLDALTEKKWLDIIKYTDEDGIILSSLCDSCAEKLGTL